MATARDAAITPAQGDIAVEGTIQSIFGNNFGIDAGIRATRSSV